MKLVTAIIRPFKLDAVREALTAIGIQGMTVTEVKGFNVRSSDIEIYRGGLCTINFIPQVKLEIVVADTDVERLIETMRGTARSEISVDGKILVIDVARAVRIRTGEVDADAI